MIAYQNKAICDNYGKKCTVFSLLEQKSGQKHGKTDRKESNFNDLQKKIHHSLTFRMFFQYFTVIFLIVHYTYF